MIPHDDERLHPEALADDAAPEAADLADRADRAELRAILVELVLRRGW